MGQAKLLFYACYRLTNIGRMLRDTEFSPKPHLCGVLVAHYSHNLQFGLRTKSNCRIHNLLQSQPRNGTGVQEIPNRLFPPAHEKKCMEKNFACHINSKCLRIIKPTVFKTKNFWSLSVFIDRSLLYTVLSLGKYFLNGQELFSQPDLCRRPTCLGAQAYFRSKLTGVSCEMNLYLDIRL